MQFLERVKNINKNDNRFIIKQQIRNTKYKILKIIGSIVSWIVIIALLVVVTYVLLTVFRKLNLVESPEPEVEETEVTTTIITIAPDDMFKTKT